MCLLPPLCPPTSFLYHSLYGSVSVSVYATLLIPLALFDPQVPKMYANSFKDLNPPRGYCGLRSQRVTET